MNVNLNLSVLLLWYACLASSEILGLTIPSVQPNPRPLNVINTENDCDHSTCFDVDSVSFKINGSRWFPRAGEIHYARIPSSAWKDELMKMKAGGLNMIDVYSFWIHHEETPQQWNTTGRRDLREFLSIANTLGLKVMLRIGPWCHGEARNGGHPDWLLAAAVEEKFELRSADSKYLAYVKNWYSFLATQIEGMYWKDGGPIIAIQLDNETPNLQYLLALRQLALQVKLAPVVFSKTLWPEPKSGVPANFSLLPFAGSYPDRFWTNDMNPTPSTSAFFFNQVSSLSIPNGDARFPYLSVELGGGMAASYNHRVHMESKDIYALHMVALGSGMTSLGYYMYHGGNNPHSLFKDDSPENSLQESSFQPAGPQNPMPSFSYDFFAPIGEFGQTRAHYHMLRKAHNMLSSYGTDMAACGTVLPDAVPHSTSDTTTLRWTMRTNGAAGFVFVSNSERLGNLSAHYDVRFQIKTSATTLLYPPSPLPGLDIENGDAFFMPVNATLAGIQVHWATAQPLWEGSSRGESFAFLSVVGNNRPSIVLGADVTVLNCSGSCTVSDDLLIAANLSVGLDITLSVMGPDKHVIHFAVLSDKQSIGSYLIELKSAAQAHALVVAENASTVMVTQGEGLFESLSLENQVYVFPPSTRVNGARGDSDGAFARFSLTQEAPPSPTVSITKIRDAAPARVLHKSASGHTQEPTSSDWIKAAQFSVSVQGVLSDTSQDVLAFSYQGDAARLYHGTRCVTDNWFSGYRGDGEMQLGLSYMRDELGLAEQGQYTLQLTLDILPTTLKYLNESVFLQQRYWPSFNASGIALSPGAVSVLHYVRWNISLTSE